jgi:hypothetical protein
MVERRFGVKLSGRFFGGGRFLFSASEANAVREGGGLSEGEESAPDVGKEGREGGRKRKTRWESTKFAMAASQMRPFVKLI